MKKIDLHTHSYYSDGTVSPTELVKRMHSAGISIISLTDHNSVDGVDEAIKAGKRLGVRVIPAVEVIAEGAEILGYFINHKSSSLRKDLRRCARNKEEKARKRMKALEGVLPGADSKLFEKEFIHSRGKHIISHIWQYFRKRGIFQEQVNEALRGVKIGRLKTKLVSIVDAIKIIRKNGGIPVLAHPWLERNPNDDVLKEENMKKYVSAGLMGIELDNGDNHDWGRTPAIEKKIKYYAKKYSLVMTSGTDYHALEEIMVPGHRIGKTLCDKKEFARLEKLAKTKR